eukprot:CAMPEP_0173120968 /NCGR_PEP_ID=MMETSP1102-20130122/52926_1 /TAXON_ID=49646 /ORGANISM="Geminigera sp., Strain Caron Lab Isolate" /LENGTH=51 /DNA_ID=CAMNT_0014027325 /DNA_START=211 /DNA_END=369 /DNA_ORIENTATION=-
MWNLIAGLIYSSNLRLCAQAVSSSRPVGRHKKMQRMWPPNYYAENIRESGC